LIRAAAGIGQVWHDAPLEMGTVRDDRHVAPKLVATDLDGTLLRTDESASRRTLAAIDATLAAGIPFVICTARPARWIRPLAPLVGGRGTAICANGGVIWDIATERVLEQFPIPSDVALEVVQRLRTVLPQAAWAVERPTAFAHEPAYRSRWPVPDDTVVDAIEVLLAAAPVKLMLRTPAVSADALLALARETVGGLVEVTHSSTADTLLEMSAAGVSKGSSLAALCDSLGIVADEVLAFGDMPNDLPMLRWAGRSVAVANAHPDVLATVGEVTASCDDDGVARVLERLL
jgi:Cof subfamily protein (haloacid dehalogenase superfamily)